MQEKPDALALFSGGLDSLLAARLLQSQGLSILCLHFYSPFFGNPDRVPHWQKEYGLAIRAIDTTRPFVNMLAGWPPHGTGSHLNPCIDCKIMMLDLAKAELASTGARFIATGEVLGQRPMSQRSESLNIISKASNSRDILLRPLSAQLLPETPMEAAGLVDRARLRVISGRGRQGQLELAREFGITEIPAPGGGCLLTEVENVRRYWPLLKMHWQNQRSIDDLAADFRLANYGRVLFHESQSAWLCIGRNEGSNARIRSARRSGDLLLHLPFAGPLAILRGADAHEDHIKEAAEILASFSGKTARRGSTTVYITDTSGRKELRVEPLRNESRWRLPEWGEVQAELREYRRRHDEKQKPV